jgi:hypothetical protein
MPPPPHQSNFLTYGFDPALGESEGRLVFVKGFFNETLPGIAEDVGRLAVLRVDGGRARLPGLPPPPTSDFVRCLCMHPRVSMPLPWAATPR